MSSVADIARRARKASHAVQTCSAADRARALQAVQDELKARRGEIEAANEADCIAAAANGVAGALSKRLNLSGRKYDAMLDGVSSVRDLADRVGELTLSRTLDVNLELYRVTAPIGVLAVVFEARPEAAVQIATLAIKSANALILKGGSEAERSNTAIANAIRAALQRVEYPADAIQLLTTRTEVKELLAQTECVDLVIPRGSNQLVKFVQDNTKIPVMGHADGLCAMYIDSNACPEKAARLAVDAKTQYPAVCNAVETFLFAQPSIGATMTTVCKALVDAGVQLRADSKAAHVLRQAAVKYMPADDLDFDTEFLDFVAAVKVVKDVNEAIDHINTHGSGHTDVIVTEDEAVARQFMTGVDSAGVFHNVSSRFADGFRYGFGAEVGISTHRTHARGPVGVEGLLIYKYKMIGSGHIVQPYADGSAQFQHKDFPPADGIYKHLV